jgi:hypothetical protein
MTSAPVAARSRQAVWLIWTAMAILMWFARTRGSRKQPGARWVARASIPFGRVGPFGNALHGCGGPGDGRRNGYGRRGHHGLLSCHLRNEDGKGGRWSKVELPHSFTYGSLHSLAVADVNGDGRPDIIANEQEELLPQGRENPRWVAWENMGGGRFAERILLDQKLGGHELQVGDVDGDGIDICSKAWGPRPWNGNAGRMHVDFLENLLKKPRSRQ